MRFEHGTVLLLSGLLLLTGCDAGGPRLGADDVAAAADFTLKVEDAARLLAPVEDLPNEREVVTALSDYWIDYTLLALAVNRPGDLERLDLQPILRQEVNRELVMRLRDEVIEVDEEVSDEELEEIYRTERPGERVRARHILLFFPDLATPAQRDSVHTLAVDLRDRARAGEDFAALARTWSDDEGSGERGGELGWITPGTTVPPFDSAVFALEPGEVSDVVESEYGLHVITVDEREIPELEEIAEGLRAEIRMERTSRAESIFVAGVETPAEVQLADGAIEAVRELARRPEQRLSDRAARRPLVRYRGGTYTVGDFRTFLMNPEPGLREQVVAATDEQLDVLLRNLTRSELLVEDARRRGIALSAEEESEFRQRIRDQYRNLAELLQIHDIEPADGESLHDAVERNVQELMRGIVLGERDIYPLGNLSIPLREHYGARISEATSERVVDRVAALRGAVPDETGPPMPAPPGGGGPPEPETPSPDTSEGERPSPDGPDA